MHRRKFNHKTTVIAAINLHFLKNAGIKGIIIDLDNTIVSEDDCYISPNGENWIKQAKLEGLKCFILSNGKRRYRVEYWSERMDIPAISPARKPLLFSFYKALRYMELKPQEIVVIGDSLHTDIVGAWLWGCSSIQVASLPHPPKWWEKLFRQWVQIPYPQDCELWQLEGNSLENSC
ncbi:MAG: YqeG family HAD IIIA-type phosphatase [Xenococcaceae cyanobacterium MO_207.B15]|nr:YqeG family HAD IIIA-type phosphatase [Xenococcaceae cyanobacterium MO_207.B15]MDJ0742721.1 YqeG family HAD IIIA-type phosphatase [Xenococcaceae cyanobacterium MO_167.B27]